MKRIKKYESDFAKVYDYYTSLIAEGNSEDVFFGRLWYEDVYESAKALSDLLGVSHYETIETIAGFNQVLSFEQSLVEASAYLIDKNKYISSRRNSFMFFVRKGTVKGSRKLQDFYMAILGDTDAVAIDRHMLPPFFNSLTDYRYKLCQHVIRKIASERSEEPRQTQAIIWCIIRRKKGYKVTSGKFDHKFVYNLGKGLIDNL